MPIMEFGCKHEDCNGRICFDYSDYDVKDATDNNMGVFEELQCGVCGHRYRTVVWVAVLDEDNEAVTYV